MKHIFAFDGPVFRFMSKLGSMILLSLCWLVCSLPVITIGASTAALFRGAFDLRQDLGGSLKSFFKAFVENFKLGTLCWLCLVACVLILYCIPNIAAVLQVQLIIMAAIAVVCAMILILWLVAVCVFPLVAYFDNTVKKTMRNALFVAVKNRKQSIPAALLAAVPVFVFCIDPMIFFYTCGIWLLVFPGAWAYFAACRFAPVFEEYGNKRKEKEEIDNEEVSE